MQVLLAFHCTVHQGAAVGQAAACLSRKRVAGGGSSVLSIAVVVDDDNVESVWIDMHCGGY